MFGGVSPVLFIPFFIPFSIPFSIPLTTLELAELEGYDEQPEEMASDGKEPQQPFYSIQQRTRQEQGKEQGQTISIAQHLPAR